MPRANTLAPSRTTSGQKNSATTLQPAAVQGDVTPLAAPSPKATVLVMLPRRPLVESLLMLLLGSLTPLRPPCHPLL